MTAHRPTAAVDILAIADTHLLAGQADRLLERIGGELRVADVVLHAGDITDPAILDALRSHVPPGCLYAVRGNNDLTCDDLPDRLTSAIGGCTVAMVHDSGAAPGRARRLRSWFPDADVVVFGHSHLPWHEVDVRAADGHEQHHVNPGSAVLRRRAPACSVAHIVVAGGAVSTVRHVTVGAPVDGAVSRGGGAVGRTVPA